ncbi:hypothetical protein ACWGDT_35755 [Streptomyces avermitilis]
MPAALILHPPIEVLRRILLHSTGIAKGQQQARDRRLAKAREELDKLQRGADGRYYNTAEKIAARLDVIAKTRRVTGCPRTEIPTDATGPSTSSTRTSGRHSENTHAVTRPLRGGRSFTGNVACRGTGRCRDVSTLLITGCVGEVARGRQPDGE